MARSYGHLISIQIANPAAGAQWSLVVPAGLVYAIRGVNCVLTTDAVAGNRSFSLQVKDTGGHVVAQFPASANVTASTATGFGGPATSAATIGVNGILFPDGAVLPSGFTLSSSVKAMDPGDQWGSISLLVEAFQA